MSLHNVINCSLTQQLSALGLVVNVLVLWNTYYMNTALNHLRLQGTPLKAEDIARLSPLAYSHINMLGRYHFNLPSELLDGGMRPLRDLNDFPETWGENPCM
ncbi:Tn3 family transposase [Laspinema sp. D2d]|uniref:Tn3 family transposase n=1 Tax=Laspinema TaxID=2584823 RepID=UPI00398329E3